MQTTDPPRNTRLTSRIGSTKPTGCYSRETTAAADDPCHEVASSGFLVPESDPHGKARNYARSAPQGVQPVPQDGARPQAVPLLASLDQQQEQLHREWQHSTLAPGPCRQAGR